MSVSEGFDVAEVGRALVTMAVTSRLMGHSDVRCTARDYLRPHDEALTPEQQFVQDLIAHGASPLVSAEVAIAALVETDLPSLPPIP